MELEAFIIKSQLTLLALSSTPLPSRDTEPLIVGLYFHHQSFFILCPPPGIVFFPLIEILFFLSEPSLVSHGNIEAFIFWNPKASCTSQSVYNFPYLIINVFYISYIPLKFLPSFSNSWEQTQFFMLGLNTRNVWLMSMVTFEILLGNIIFY